MSPVTHFLTGWALANVARLERRERALVTVAAVIPDVDGLGAIPELLTRGSAHPLLWFSQYHHALHTLLFAVVVTVVAFALATRRWTTAALVFVAFHVHLLEDVIGGRGPDGYGWPIPYLQPFSNAWTWTWSGQWQLNAWPNVALTCALIVVMMWIAVKRGRTPVEFVSCDADEAVVRTLRARFVRA
jgi:LexA-binding, inner membrane-associated putative hydrolase